MYKEFYGFKEEPFNITPDPEFLYWSQKHQEAFRHLIHSIRNQKGLILLTGEAGVGKTTIVNALIQNIDSTAITAIISNSKLNAYELFQSISYEFGLNVNEESKAQYIFELHKFLVKCHSEGRDVILVLDEAQNFSFDILEEIRLLSNIETAKEKLIQIILVGQSLLLNKINSKNLEQLKQRIGLYCHLHALNKFETHLYIKKRLEIAESPNVSLFDNEATEEIFLHSKGIPRVINTICDAALLFGATAKRSRIDTRIIRQVVESLTLNSAAEESSTSVEPQDQLTEQRRESEKGGSIDNDDEMLPYIIVSNEENKGRTKQRLGLFITTSIIVIVILCGVMIARVEVVGQSLATVSQAVANFVKHHLGASQPAMERANDGMNSQLGSQPGVVPGQAQNVSGLSGPEMPDEAILPSLRKSAKPIEPSPEPRETSPRFLDTSEPQYPMVARLRGWEGTVTLRIEMRADGTIGQVNVVDSSGYPILDAAAIQTVQAWTHIPAMRDGSPVTRWTNLPVRFRLDPGRADEPDLIRQAQELLQRAGYGPGPIDGIPGPQTAAALRRYQRQHGLPETGALDAATRKALGTR